MPAANGSFVRHFSYILMQLSKALTGALDHIAINGQESQFIVTEAITCTQTHTLTFTFVFTFLLHSRCYQLKDMACNVA